ncbi:MAG TPA: ATP-binding protein [Anaerolineales bacterium]|nr:ATP-binding protein [Anaerolineales bacterium]
MRSLATKLTLAFLFVGLIGAVLVAVLVRQFTQRQFGQLVLDQNQQLLVAHLTSYYEANGSWAGVERAFRPGFETLFPRNQGPDWEARRSLFLIADADGKVVFGGGNKFYNQKLDSSALKTGAPIVVGGDTTGWLIFAPALDRWEPGTPEGNFLLGVNRATILSALAATGFALIVGGILAYTLTRSLRELTSATKVLAEGNLGYQVQVRSQDELGELADSFNQMSSQLEQSNQLRRKMTADIAHDLRTPLSVIMGYTEALNDGKLEPDPEMFEVLHTETLHLSLLIDDLKTISLADAGELPLTYQTITPDIILKRTANAYRVQAEHKQVKILTDLPQDLPNIQIDVERMMQVLGNLMSNALRYTPQEGQIKLSADRLGEQVRICVADNGAGIAPEELPFVFERSFRGDKARQQGNGETGLGLAIAKSLVEAQGGQINVESRPGEGTKFTILLAPP